MIVKQILLVSIKGNVERNVWRICKLMLGCKVLNLQCGTSLCDFLTLLLPARSRKQSSSLCAIHFWKLSYKNFFFLTGLSAWKCIDNFIYGFYTHNNTAFTAHVITNLTYLISHTRTRPPATSWPVIRNIATWLEMKVQEAVDIDGQTTLWLYIQLYNN